VSPTPGAHAQRGRGDGDRDPASVSALQLRSCSPSRCTPGYQWPCSRARTSISRATWRRVSRSVGAAPCLDVQPWLVALSCSSRCWFPTPPCASRRGWLQRRPRRRWLGIGAIAWGSAYGHALRRHAGFSVPFLSPTTSRRPCVLAVAVATSGFAWRSPAADGSPTPVSRPARSRWRRISPCTMGMAAIAITPRSATTPSRGAVHTDRRRASFIALRVFSSCARATPAPAAPARRRCVVMVWPSAACTTPHGGIAIFQRLLLLGRRDLAEQLAGGGHRPICPGLLGVTLVTPYTTRICSPARALNTAPRARQQRTAAPATTMRSPDCRSPAVPGQIGGKSPA